MMNKGNCGVYEILNTKNSKRYIGSSNQLNRRETVHFSALRNNRHGNTHLQNSFNKYGEENFEFNVIVYCDESRQYEYEQFYLDRWETYKQQKGYNINQEALNPPTMEGKDNPTWSEKVELTCKVCGNSFKVVPSKKDERSHCSIECRSETYKTTHSGKNSHFWKERIEVSCEVCGKDMKVPPSLKDKRFCSNECMGKHKSKVMSGKDSPCWKEREEKECRNCNKKFLIKPWLDKKYCSRDCYYDNVESNHAHSPLNKKQVKEIKERLKEGETQKSISEDFPVKRRAISDINTGRTWDDVEV